MAYIGKSPTGTGVRSRFHFTATGGETSLSGADDNGKTLVFADGEYVDVYLNGVLLFDGDYNTTTANTIGGLDALTASDVVEIVVYDIFSVADTVSAKNGGTFNGDVALSGSNLNFGDNDKAQFGDGDLQIYHDGSNSYINDAGTGNLVIKGANIAIDDTSDQRLATFVSNGRAELMYAGSEKLRTTSTGVDVTGRITTDGITEDTSGNLGVGKTSPAYRGHFADASNATRVQIENTNNAAAGAGVYLTTYSSGSLVSNSTLAIDNSGNLKIFTGTTAGSERMRIAANGIVTKANHPAFYANKNATFLTNNTDIVFDTVRTNVGSHYNSSNGKFTAPVDGTYFFSYGTLLNTTSTNAYGYLRLAFNGSGNNAYIMHSSYNSTRNYEPLSWSGVVDLDAGDEVTVQGYFQNSNTYGGSSYTFFSGHLLG